MRSSASPDRMFDIRLRRTSGTMHAESRRFAETCTLHPHNRTCRIKQTHMKNSPFWLCTAFKEIRAGRARKYSANLTAEVCAKYREEEWVERERQRGLDALVSVWYVLLS